MSTTARVRSRRREHARGGRPMRSRSPSRQYVVRYWAPRWQIGDQRLRRRTAETGPSRIPGPGSQGIWPCRCIGQRRPPKYMQGKSSLNSVRVGGPAARTSAAQRQSACRRSRGGRDRASAPRRRYSGSVMITTSVLFLCRVFTWPGHGKRRCACRGEDDSTDAVQRRR